MYFRYLDRLSFKKKKDFLKGLFKIEVKPHQHLTLLGTLIMYATLLPCWIFLLLVDLHPQRRKGKCSKWESHKYCTWEPGQLMQGAVSQSSQTQEPFTSTRTRESSGQARKVLLWYPSDKLRGVKQGEGIMVQTAAVQRSWGSTELCMSRNRKKAQDCRAINDRKQDRAVQGG